MLANLDGIIRDPKRLRAVTMLDPEQFDYLCVRFAQRVAERGLYRLFWDDDARASDSGTRSKLYVRHAPLMSLLHKKEANTEDTLGVFFGIDQGTAGRYLKVVNGVLAEILPTARNLTETIRGIYARDGGAGGGAGGGAEGGPDGTAEGMEDTLTWGGPEPPESVHETRSTTPARGGCARHPVDPAIMVSVRPSPPQKLPF